MTKAQGKKEKGQYFWNETENIKYREFVEKNLELLLKPLKERKAHKINIMMSKYIKSRTSCQCRSHHQKMLQNHKNVLQLLNFLKNHSPEIKVEEYNSNEEIHNSPESWTPKLKFIEQTEGSSSLWDRLINSPDSHTYCL